MHGWPSGLRRHVQVVVYSVGVGSNPTSCISFFSTFPHPPPSSGRVGRHMQKAERVLQMRFRRPRAQLLARETRVRLLCPWPRCPTWKSRRKLRTCPVRVWPPLCETVDLDDWFVWHEVQLLRLWLWPHQRPGHLCLGSFSSQRKSILQWTTTPGRSSTNDAFIQPLKSTRTRLIRQANVCRIKRRLRCRFIWRRQGDVDLATTQYAVLWRTRKLSVHHWPHLMPKSSPPIETLFSSPILTSNCPTQTQCIHDLRCKYEEMLFWWVGS